MPTKKIHYTPDFLGEIKYKGSNLSEHTKLATGEQINGIDLADLVGPAGSQGDSGINGSNGATGAKGDKGDTGNTGLAGIDGDDGATGVKGAKGDTGNTGLAGTDGTNGSMGAKGNTGDTGLPPANGWSGTSLRFQNPNGTWTGYVDLKGSTGATGAKGNTGNTGAAGSNGSTGAKGDQGDPGIKGNTGNTGAAGTNGSQGIQGVKGNTGNTGSQGATGPQGPTGLLNSTTQTVFGTKTFNNTVYAPDFAESSDRELKNILTQVEGKSLTLLLKPVTYSWKKGDTKSIHLGFVAQDVHKVHESLVNTMPNGFLGVKYSKVTVLNTAAIQEHDKEIQELRKMVIELKAPKRSKLVNFLIKLGL